MESQRTWELLPNVLTSHEDALQVRPRPLHLQHQVDHLRHVGQGSDPVRNGPLETHEVRRVLHR